MLRFEIKFKGGNDLYFNVFNKSYEKTKTNNPVSSSFVIVRRALKAPYFFELLNLPRS